jgi:hypothetical protein
MAFNPQQAMIDRTLRITGFDLTTGKQLFTTDQLENLSWEFTGEGMTKNDAMGTPIATFDRAKGQKIGGEASLLNFSLMAAQRGSDIVVASAAAKITVPYFEIITVGASAGTTPNLTITLTKTPKTAPNFIYLLNTDKTVNTSFSKDESAASATEFTIAEKVITLPVGASITCTDKIAIWYDYESENAIQFEDSATDFADMVKLDVEVLFADMCNPNTKYYGHIIMPKAKPDSNFSVSLKTDGTHPFSFEAHSDYCDADRKLSYTVIPQ